MSGVAEGLGITQRVTSPTFLITRIYTGGFLPLLHADVYRLSSLAEFEDLGLLDTGADGAVMIEWGDAVAEALPSSHLRIEFQVEDEARKISFHPEGDWIERDLEVVA